MIFLFASSWILGFLYLLVLLLLWRIFPKGNPLREFLDLAPWWFKMYRLPRRNQQKTKIKYGRHRKQYFLLFEPLSHIPQKNTIVFYFHGGGWQFGRPEGFSPHAQHLTNLGYTVIMPSHRRLPFNDYYALREDLSLLLEKASDLISKKNWLSKKLIFSGMSSGANLAALSTLDKEEMVKTGFPSDNIKGLLLLGAPLNLLKMRWSPTLYWLGGGRNSEMFKKANPINYLNESIDFRILAIHGTKDGLVEYSNVVTFFKKLGNQPGCELITVPNGTHLEIAGWTFKQDEIQEKINTWMKEIDQSNT